MKRIFLIVIDSCGAGELPDAADFGDVGANTLKSCARSKLLSIPNLVSMGIGNIDGLDFLGKAEKQTAAVGKLAEVSRGKDTTVGHWEISGIISSHPFPTYPDGFPDEIIDKLREATGREILCNKPYSGTQVILDYGEEQKKTGGLIVYTSADSVLQIAANEADVPVSELYDYCLKAREIMIGEYGVGRIIARPYVGEYPNYTRTSSRRDFSLEPTGVTMLDDIKAAGLDSIAVGKIEDIFAGRGITKAIHTGVNSIGLDVTDEMANTDFNGLCFVNLVDTDMLYGHRNDIDGYANALTEIDTWLGDFKNKLGEDDLLIVTADHGCDPGDISTDHTREYVPIVIYGDRVKPVNLGVRRSFSDIAATVTELFGVEYHGEGESFADEIIADDDEYLMKRALKAAKASYCPYSGFAVGAALLTSDGRIYTGCNIENAAFSPTVCAERTAIFKAVSDGVRSFEKIAVVGGVKSNIDIGVAADEFPPCGVCRQVMSEFCDPDKFKIILGSPEKYSVYRLGELLPRGFSPKNMEK